MTHAEQLRARRAKRIAAGLCRDCGAIRAPTERSMCEFCRDKQRRYHETHVRARRSQYVQATQRYHRKMVAAGRCVTCGKVNERAPKSMCQACQDRATLARKSRFCANPLRWERESRRIVASKRKLRKRYEKAGLCYECGKEPARAGGKYGESCLVRKARYRLAAKIREGSAA